jgi:hypothetical protein
MTKNIEFQEHLLLLTDFGCNRHIMVATIVYSLCLWVIQLEEQQNVRILIKWWQSLQP